MFVCDLSSRFSLSLLTPPTSPLDTAASTRAIKKREERFSPLWRKRRKTRVIIAVCLDWLGLLTCANERYGTVMGEGWKEKKHNLLLSLSPTLTKPQIMRKIDLFVWANGLSSCEDLKKEFFASEEKNRKIHFFPFIPFFQYRK